MITAWGEDPVPTVCLPTKSVLITGLTPSFSEINTANAPNVSSKIGKSFLTWSLPFIPNFAEAPPATITTFLYVPAFTNDAALINEWVGAAQKPLRSEPVAFIAPDASAIALAKFPPPLWFISPQASSEHSIT